MKYTHKISKSQILFTFTGDLIGENNGPEIVEVTNDALSKDVKFCLIDISDVRYINSSGVGVLITMLTKFRNKSGELYLIKPSEHVQKLLIITKLQGIFNIAQTIEEAQNLINNSK